LRVNPLQRRPVLYILCVQNIATHFNRPESAWTLRGVTTLTDAPRTHADPQFDEARRTFIEDFGQLFARYGLAPTFGRVFGLLLMSDQPLSLDNIAGQLRVSKSGVSVATRDLERLGVARRSGSPGSRRVLYEAADNMEPIFEAQFTRIRQSLAIIQRGTGLLPGERAGRRLDRMRELHQFWLEESQGILERWRARQ